MEQVYTVEEVAEILRIHPKTVYKLLSSGELNGIKAGRAWRVHSDALSEYLRPQNSTLLAV